VNLDELIKALIEAKEHCVDGRSEILIVRNIIEPFGYITDVKFDSKNVIIYYE
jgi:hypothetical protein